MSLTRLNGKIKMGEDSQRVSKKRGGADVLSEPGAEKKRRLPHPILSVRYRKSGRIGKRRRAHTKGRRKNMGSINSSHSGRATQEA